VVKETALRSMVYAGTGLVIGVGALWAFVFIPRLATHPLRPLPSPIFEQVTEAEKRNEVWGELASNTGDRRLNAGSGLPMRAGEGRVFPL